MRIYQSASMMGNNPIMGQPGGVPRRRAAHSKVKTGCKTCRIRRIKCDEGKPNCLRCIQNRFSCEWFPPPSTHAKPSKKSVQPRRLFSSDKNRSEPRVTIQPRLQQKAEQHCDAVSSPSGISSHPFQSDLEHRYFRVFCEKVTTQLSGLVESPIWSRLVLQASEYDESIRNAIIAVGALDLTLQAARAVAHVDPLVAMDEHHSFAIRQYSKAISQMRISISEDKHNLRNTLLGTLVIVCFESLHGNHESALAQVRSSLKLLEDWIGRQAASSWDVENQSQLPSALHASENGLRSPAPDTIEDELVQAFGRLDMQAISYADPRPISYHVAFKDCGETAIRQMPYEFSSIGQAKVYWELIMRRIMHFIASKMEPNSQSPSGDIRNAAPGGTAGIMNTNVIPELESTPDPFHEERKKYVDECSHWASAYSPLRRKMDLAEGSEHFVIDNFFSLRFKITIITLVCSLAGSQMVYDAYLQDFEEAVEHCRIVLTHSTTIFTFHSQIIVHLYVTAIRCRDRSVRRRAIDLLLSRPFREGVWDSIVTGNMAKAVMEVEEEGGSAGAEDEIVPEEKRVRGTAMTFDMAKRSGKLKCFLKINGEIAIRERDIKW